MELADMTGGQPAVAEARTLICPVTGLPVERRPEWSTTTLGDGFQLNYSRIGDDILLSQPSGYATRPDMEKAVEFIRGVVAEAFPDGRPIVEIGDPSNLTGMSLAARRTYVRYLQNFGRHAGLVFMGASPLFEMAIRLGIRLKLVKFPVKIARDYPEAMILALAMVSEDGTRPGAAAGAGPEVLPLAVSRDDWRLDLEGLSTRFEVVDGDVLHSVSSGYMSQEHVEHVAELRRRVTSSLISPGDINYFVGGVDEVQGVDRRARHEYMDSLKRWHESHPLRIYVLYGANWFLRTAARMAAPFMPFRVSVARDLDEARRIVAADRARSSRAKPRKIEKMFSDHPARTPEVTGYVEELLHYIGSINWEADGIDLDMPPDHPFKSVFDALRLVKSELDELFSEREKVEQALRESESRYRYLVEMASEAVVVAQGDRLVFVNSTAEKISGWTKEEMTSRPFLEMVHPEDRAGVAERHRQRFSGEQVTDQNRYRILTKDGGEKWIEVTGVLIDWQGQPASLNLFTDITIRKQAEEEREQLIIELQEALVKVKTLRGLIPICASCKKIRDDKGFWKQVEVYVGEHSDAEFSHGLCPDCMRKFYPDYVEESDFIEE
jgi:PAS domain S-box-containing protein